MTASSNIIAAMANDLSPQSPNPLRDKLFHTSIRIDSVEDIPRDDDPAILGRRLIEQKTQSAQDVADQHKAAEMRAWFDEAMGKNLGKSEGYSKVAVLLIKWDKGLDELNTAEETEELRSLFADQFNYHCKIIELNCSSKPQLQMNRYVSAFVEENDGPNSLMIVYYTGHGVWRENDNYLELTASTTPGQKWGFKNEARVNWEKAEEQLRSDDVEGDVLTILDTCYSSNPQFKSGREDTRSFELLSACTYDAPTPAPGPLSFTRALIDGLKDLLQEYKDRPFTTFHLNQRILTNPKRRDYPSQLWFRLKHHERHILLAPLKPEPERLQEASLFKPPRGYLTLRFALNHSSLNREQIDILSRNLTEALGKKHKTTFGLRKIEWIEMKPAPTTPFGRVAAAWHAIALWKKLVHRRREERRRKQIDDVVRFADSTAQSPVLSPTRKRSRDNEEGLPKRKKGLLVIPPSNDSPPSPPVSDSSRVEELNDGDVEIS